MKRMASTLSIVFLVLCLFQSPCPAQGTAEGGSDKDASLYLYYRRELSPYLAGLRPKTREGYGETGQGRGFRTGPG